MVKIKKFNQRVILEFLDADANGTVVYDKPIVHHHHTPKNDFNLIRKIKETPSVHPTMISTNAQ